MIIAKRYTTEQIEGTNDFKIRNLDAPFCPSCGSLCSGYDTRSRHSIDGAGLFHRFALRRLRCPVCHKLHIEVPDFMRPRKRYAAEVIDSVVEGRGDSCLADDRTMRRWRRENYPPEMSGFSKEAVINLSLNLEMRKLFPGNTVNSLSGLRIVPRVYREPTMECYTLKLRLRVNEIRRAYLSYFR